MPSTTWHFFNYYVKKLKKIKKWELIKAYEGMKKLIYIEEEDCNNTSLSWEYHLYTKATHP